MIFRDIEDRDLILRSRKGDVDAYNVLVSRWEKRVYNYLLKQLQNREDALDLTQDTFLKAYQGLPRLKEPDKFMQWLFRIARNEAVSLFRRTNRFVDEEVPEVAEGGVIGVAGMRAFPREWSITVETALNRLTPEQRETVLLKVYEGFKFHEIAEILSCPVSTVKSRLYTAFDTLKASLAPIAND